MFCSTRWQMVSLPEALPQKQPALEAEEMAQQDCIGSRWWAGQRTQEKKKPTVGERGGQKRRGPWRYKSKGLVKNVAGKSGKKMMEGFALGLTTRSLLVVFSGTDSVKCGGGHHVIRCQHVLWEPGKKDRKFHKSFNRLAFRGGQNGVWTRPFHCHWSHGLCIILQMFLSQNIALFELLTFIWLLVILNVFSYGYVQFYLCYLCSILCPVFYILFIIILFILRTYLYIIISLQLYLE